MHPALCGKAGGCEDGRECLEMIWALQIPFLSKRYPQVGNVKHRNLLQDRGTPWAFPEMCILPLEQELWSFVGVCSSPSETSLYKTGFSLDERDPRRTVSWWLRVAALTTVFLLKIQVVYSQNCSVLQSKSRDLGTEDDLSVEQSILVFADTSTSNFTYFLTVSQDQFQAVGSPREFVP